MAKVMIEVDTETSSLKVTANGKTIDNVTSVMCGVAPSYQDQEADRVYCDISTQTEDEESGLMTTQRLSCCGAELVNKTKSVQEDIAKHFGRGAK